MDGWGTVCPLSVNTLLSRQNKQPAKEGQFIFTLSNSFHTRVLEKAVLEGVINLSRARALPFKGHMCPTGELGCKIRLLCLMFSWETGVLGFTCVNSSPGSLGAGFVSQINCREHKTTFKREAALSVP